MVYSGPFAVINLYGYNMFMDSYIHECCILSCTEWEQELLKTGRQPELLCESFIIKSDCTASGCSPYRRWGDYIIGNGQSKFMGPRAREELVFFASQMVKFR